MDKRVTNAFSLAMTYLQLKIVECKELGLQSWIERYTVELDKLQADFDEILNERN